MSAEENKNINLSSYVAIGDSITAGYTDGALFYKGQQYSYANLLAQQFKLTSDLNFTQPLMKPESVGIGFFGNSRIVLKNIPDYTGAMALCPSYIAAEGDITVFSENVFSAQGPFNNMSVPAAKVISLEISGLGNPANGIGNFNPFFYRTSSNPATASVLSDALALDPTFFTLFMGNNDILTYALSGGTMNAITTPADFEKSLLSVINALTKTGARGAIANLPDITSIPHFTSIPFDGLLLNAERAATLNEVYKPMGLHFTEGRNAFVISDPLGSPQGVRQIVKGELILLSIMFDAEKNNYLSGKTPIPKKYFLTATQLLKIKMAHASFNQSIKHIARVSHLGFVNIDLFLKKLKAEITFDERGLNVKFKKGSVFSLDGLHLAPFGQSLLANLFIKAINYSYKANIEKLKTGKFKSITFY